jgi:hypothetical protein
MGTEPSWSFVRRSTPCRVAMALVRCVLLLGLTVPAPLAFLHPGVRRPAPARDLRALVMQLKGDVIRSKEGEEGKPLERKPGEAPSYQGTIRRLDLMRLLHRGKGIGQNGSGSSWPPRMPRWSRPSTSSGRYEGRYSFSPWLWRPLIPLRYLTV